MQRCIPEWAYKSKVTWNRFFSNNMSTELADMKNNREIKLDEIVSAQHESIDAAATSRPASFWRHMYTGSSKNRVAHTQTRMFSADTCSSRWLLATEDHKGIENILISTEVPHNWPPLFASLPRRRQILHVSVWRRAKEQIRFLMSKEYYDDTEQRLNFHRTKQYIICFSSAEKTTPISVAKLDDLGGAETFVSK